MILHKTPLITILEEIICSVFAILMCGGGSGTASESPELDSGKADKSAPQVEDGPNS